MADAAPKEPIAGMADLDWVVIEGQQPDNDNDDAASMLSECDTVGKDCVRVDSPKTTRYQGRLYHNPDDRAIGPIPTLRRALYVLKDGLTASVQNLTEFNNVTSKEDTLDMSIPILRVQKRQLEVVQRLLTNIGHDWERSAASGGMTFDEYAELDADNVNKLGITMNEFAQTVREPRLGGGPHFLQMILPAVGQVSALLKMDDVDRGLATEQEVQSSSGSEADGDAVDFGIGTVEYIEYAPESEALMTA